MSPLCAVYWFTGSSSSLSRGMDQSSIPVGHCSATILALHSKQSTLHQSAPPSAASPIGILNVGDPSVPAATIKSNTGQRFELVPQHVSELEKPSMTCAKPRADNSDLAQAGVSKTSQFETSKFSWSRVGNWAAPTVASPKVTDHDIEHFRHP
ncbi:hypothetical protein EV360DRAFT_90459 [Lentinula raphanica]|nr:hypothetical protein EV360DRAFT_90459 [Lentinula raphanica]